MELYCWDWTFFVQGEHSSHPDKRGGKYNISQLEYFAEGLNYGYDDVGVISVCETAEFE